MAMHILAFDDTDQAECRSAEDMDPCMSDPKKVDCEHCLCALDDVGRHPG